MDKPFEERPVKYTDGTCSREIEECDPIAPARGIFNGIVVSVAVFWIPVGLLFYALFWR